jgi:hypothetical protein
MEDFMCSNKIGRPVKIVSISFGSASLEEIAGVVDREGKIGTDVIVLPETWRTYEPETLEGETIVTMATLAKKHNTYIACPIYRKDENRSRINSSVLLDRHGAIVCVYDKVYPYWSEFDLTPPCSIGTDTPIYEADFGRVGMAVCFDANFPEVWKLLSDHGAELVLWPSAYSAGTTLQAHALNHQYYIITSTSVCDCCVFDITGKEIFYKKEPGICVSRVMLDLDRGIYHENFNLDKRDRLIRECEGAVVQELHMEREQWFVLKAAQPNVSARETAKQYGLEELRDYKDRSRREIDAMRGCNPR